MDLYLHRIKSAIFLFWTLIILASCNIDQVPNLDKTYLPPYQGEIALLIINDTIQFGKFLEETITDTSKYSIEPDKSIVFKYDFQTDFSTGDDFVKVDNFSNSKYLASPIETGGTVPKDTVLQIRKELVFNFPTKNREEVDSVYYSAGTLQLDVNTSFPSEVQYTFSTQAFIDRATGDSIYVDATIAQPASPPGTDKKTFDLNGYKTNLITSSDSNKFIVHLNANVYLKQGMNLSGNEYLFMKLSVSNPYFDAIFGAFGKDTFNVKEQHIKLDFLQDLGGDKIEFESPTIDFSIDNSFGIPAAVDFSTVFAAYDTDSLYFSGSFPDNPQSIGSPSLEQFGSSIHSNLIINDQNSNLREILAGSPNELVLPIRGYSNLTGDGKNFLTHDAKIDINAVVSIPLKLRVDGFEYTSNVDLGNLKDLDGTSEISLLIITQNELPFSGWVNLFFLDESGNKLDSLVNQSIFTTPTEFDSSGKVTAPSENKVEINMDQNLINTMINANKMKVVVGLDSYNSSKGDFVELFSDYDLKVKVGLAGNISLNLN